MNRGMIIQCGGCGFSRFVNLNGSPEEIEAELHQTVIPASEGVNTE